MSEHFTLRFQAGTVDRLTRRARSVGTPARSLAARYVEEGIRRDDHPHIFFVDGQTGRRAALLGTKLDVWEVVATVRDNGNEIAAAADYLGVPPSLVESAVSYYGEFAAEIDGEIALNDAESERAALAYERGRQALGQ